MQGSQQGDTQRVDEWTHEEAVVTYKVVNSIIIMLLWWFADKKKLKQNDVHMYLGGREGE